jgi:hypothetical protein
MQSMPPTPSASLVGGTGASIIDGTARDFTPKKTTDYFLAWVCVDAPRAPSRGQFGIAALFFVGDSRRRAFYSQFLLLHLRRGGGGGENARQVAAGTGTTGSRQSISTTGSAWGSASPLPLRGGLWHRPAPLVQHLVSTHRKGAHGTRAIWEHTAESSRWSRPRSIFSLDDAMGHI